MPLSSDFFFKRSIVLTIVAVSISQAAVADPNNNNHPSIISVPSMGEDFVRPPDLNSRDLAQPHAGDFRYMKMNYATSKGDPDSSRDESEGPGQPPPGGKPLPARGGEPGAGPPPDHPPGGPSASHSDKLGSIDLTPLNLSPEQKQKIQDMRRETGKKIRDLRKALKTKRDELFNATFDPEISEASIREKRDTVRTLHEQMEDLMFEDLIGLRNLLTPEQKKHLAEVKPPPPPPGRFGPPGEGPPRMESVRMDGTKTDAFTRPNIAKSDPAVKSDASKGPGSKSDSSAKSDAARSATPKN
jgi:Spy/CpxP family protein refolding chaperone